MNFLKKRIAIVTLLSILCIGAVKVDNYFEITKNIELFSAVYKELHVNYVEELSPGELMKTGIDAMLASLDPYTNFYTEGQAVDALIQRKGDYGTPGIELLLLQGNLVVSAIKNGSSAQVQGVLLGDKLLSVNQIDMRNKPISEAYAAFEGAAGSFLTIRVLRDTDTLSFQLIREKLNFKNVPYYGMISKDIAYIKLDQFMDHSATEVKTAFLELKTAYQPKGVILDLRNNGGGLLTNAVRILNIFCEKNITMVVNRGKSESFKQAFQTMEDPVDTKILLTVLINENSASASEIVAGAIQDLDRGVVIGRKSFGKGLVQNILPLPYRHQMKVTIAKYYIPSGRCVQQIDYSKKYNSNDSSQDERVFFTKNKRKVTDGKGIFPDINLPDKEESAFGKALSQQHLFFKFVTAHNKQIKFPEDVTAFQLKEQTLADFKLFCEKEGFNYQTATENTLDKLKENSKKEGYDAGLTPIILQLQEQANRAKSQDWQTYSTWLKDKLTLEFARFHYGSEAIYPLSFQQDKDVLKAIELIRNPVTYYKLLQP